MICSQIFGLQIIFALGRVALKLAKKLFVGLGYLDSSTFGIVVSLDEEVQNAFSNPEPLAMVALLHADGRALFIPLGKQASCVTPRAGMNRAPCGGEGEASDGGLDFEEKIGLMVGDDFGLIR